MVKEESFMAYRSPVEGSASLAIQRNVLEPPELLQPSITSLQGNSKMSLNAKSYMTSLFAATMPKQKNWLWN